MSINGSCLARLPAALVGSQPAGRAVRDCCAIVRASRRPGRAWSQEGLESSEGGFSRGPDFGNDDELRLILADNYNRATTGTTKAQRTHKDA
ncbi:MAG: hypothetical protein NTU95_11690 [Methanothrix sp.]|nr:hypothetical protein [Methanothrix sp.]